MDVKQICIIKNKFYFPVVHRELSFAIKHMNFMFSHSSYMVLLKSLQCNITE